MSVLVPTKSTVNVVDKKVILERDRIVKLQLITYCYLHNLTLSDLAYECLTVLAMLGEVDLTKFCNAMANRRAKEKRKTWQPVSEKDTPPTPSPQTIRNILIKAEKDQLLVKTGKGYHKKISIDPNLKIQTNGNILLNYKFVHVGTKEIS